MDKEALFQALDNKDYQKIITLFHLPAGSDLEAIVTHICQTTSNPSEAYALALKYPTFPFSLDIIEAHEKNVPKEKEIVPAKNQQPGLQPVLRQKPHLATSLFHSRHEQLFFAALRNCFPHYFIYPKAMLGAIINTTLVKDILGPGDMKVFANTIVDFVLIDQFDDFKPVLAVDLNNQDTKDTIKDKVFKAAGLPLFRITNHSKYTSLDECEMAVRQAINANH